MKRLILISACFAASSQVFAQNESECVKTAVNLTGNQVTLTTSGQNSTTWRPSYVYYEKKRLRKRDSFYAVPGVEEGKYASAPVQLSNWQDVKAVPEKYNVSVAVPESNVTACPDSSVDVTAMVNVERVAFYTGNYPGTKVEPTYHKVSKRHYKMALRKKRKIERKQEKIARRAEVKVETRSTKA